MKNETTTLADHLSAILRDPRTPVSIYNAITESLAEIENKSRYSSEEYKTSPEFLERLLAEA